LAILVNGQTEEKAFTETFAKYFYLKGESDMCLLDLPVAKCNESAILLSKREHNLPLNQDKYFSGYKANLAFICSMLRYARLISIHSLGGSLCD